MNVKLLNRIKAHILEEPARVRMSNYVRSGAPSDKLEIEDLGDFDDACNAHSVPGCGTVACIAGWAVLLGHGDERSSFFPFHDTATRLLDIDEGEADILFLPNHWPEAMLAAYAKAKTPAGKARVVARRIDRFIRTHGAE